MKVSIPQLGKSYRVQQKKLNPYTPFEQGQSLSTLRGRSLLIDFQREIDGPQTATRLVREALGEFGVAWINNVEQAEAVVWIQAGSNSDSFAFVVAHPEVDNKFIAAQCGPRELTATVMTAIGLFFSSSKPSSMNEVQKTLIRVHDLNRAITGAALAQDWEKARRSMTDLAAAVSKLGSIGGTESVKAIADALADSAAAYAQSRIPEAKALCEAAIEALGRIGKDAVPWIEEGLTHSVPEVREAFHRARESNKG